jgi:hypothetical protein
MKLHIFDWVNSFSHRVSFAMILKSPRNFLAIAGNQSFLIIFAVNFFKLVGITMPSPTRVPYDPELAIAINALPIPPPLSIETLPAAREMLAAWVRYKQSQPT